MRRAGLRAPDCINRGPRTASFWFPLVLTWMFSILLDSCWKRAGNALDSCWVRARTRCILAGTRADSSRFAQVGARRHVMFPLGALAMNRATTKGGTVMEDRTGSCRAGCGAGARRGNEPGGSFRGRSGEEARSGAQEGIGRRCGRDSHNIELGKRGEDAAARFLYSTGLRDPSSGIGRARRGKPTSSRRR